MKKNNVNDISVTKCFLHILNTRIMKTGTIDKPARVFVYWNL